MYGLYPYMKVMKQETAKSSRIEARIAPDALLIVKRAAEIQGRSVSDFIVAAAQAAAHDAIAEAQIIRLSVDDQQAFAESILRPASPTKAMRNAAKAHGSLVRVSL